MQNIFTSYVKLFNGKLEKKEKEKTIKDLERFLLSARFKKLIDSPAMTPIRETLEKSFREIKVAHNKGEDAYTDYRVKNLISTCIACHSQLPSTAFKAVKKRKSYEKEEFHDRLNMALLLRDYEHASSILKDEVQKDIIRGKDFRAIETKLNLLTSIQLSKLNNKKKLLSYLSSLKLHSNYTLLIDAYTGSIKKSLKRWKGIETSRITEKKLSKLLKKFLMPIEKGLSNIYFSTQKDIVTMAQMKSILSEFILLNPESKKIAEALYWRGAIENKYTALDIYSLGELYYKECISKYPQSPFAKKCYKNLKKSIEMGFTGSSGTHIPQAILLELKSYKKMIK